MVEDKNNDGPDGKQIEGAGQQEKEKKQKKHKTKKRKGEEPRIEGKKFISGVRVTS